MTLKALAEAIGRLDLLCAAVAERPDHEGARALLRSELVALADPPVSERLDDCSQDLALALARLSGLSDQLRIRLDLADTQDTIEGLAIWSMERAMTELRAALPQLMSCIDEP